MKDITNDLPQVIADHIAAHNMPDPQAFLATFAPDALVNDALREFVGHDAIRAWAAKEIFGCQPSWSRILLASPSSESTSAGRK